MRYAKPLSFGLTLVPGCVPRCPATGRLTQPMSTTPSHLAGHTATILRSPKLRDIRDEQLRRNRTRFAPPRMWMASGGIMGNGASGQPRCPSQSLTPSVLRKPQLPPPQVTSILKTRVSRDITRKKRRASLMSHPGPWDSSPGQRPSTESRPDIRSDKRIWGERFPQSLCPWRL